MVIRSLSKLLLQKPFRNISITRIRRCSGVFGIQDLIVQEKPEFIMDQVRSEHHQLAVDMIKKYYLPSHVLVRARRMDLSDDRALDEYLVSLIKQGNTLFAKSEDDKIAGICVGFASCPVDVKNLRTYAFYRQDPNTKDFLYFTAKLQETPNLWETFKQQKIYEISMLAVVPEFRRQGLGSAMVEASRDQAYDQGFNVIRMNCINPYDYKVAERCMFSCVVKFPIHRLRGPHAPFIKRSSSHNNYVRVYVSARPIPDVPDLKAVKEKQREMESLIE